MKTRMKVNFEDTVQNWRLWGELVAIWVYDIQPKPANAAELVNQMTAHGITGASVIGPPDRVVNFHSYGNDNPFVIVLPTEQKMKAARKALQPGQRYPLPVFYDAAYDGPRRVFTADDEILFAACRIGEYTVSACT